MNIKDEIARLVGEESAGHKRLIEYVTRQLAQGRTLAEVIDDPYLTNRLNPLERRALIEEPEVVRAAQAESLDDLRTRLEDLAAR